MLVPQEEQAFTLKRAESKLCPWDLGAEISDGTRMVQYPMQL